MKQGKPTLMWAMVSKSGYVDCGTISFLRKECIDKLVKSSGKTWKEWQKYWKDKDYGWLVKRVVVTIESAI